MDAATRRYVRERSDDRCEYCGLRQQDSEIASLQIEHVIPRKHGGGDEEDNLALACIDCNLHKGSDLTGIDPETGEIMVLFHPRHMEWDEHFCWDGLRIVGLTSVGRTTVRVLDLNSRNRLDLRADLESKR